jgi:outer membrane biosynthesis protein TonB
MNRRNRNIFIAIILSVLFHAGIIYIIDFFDWLNIKVEQLSQEIPDEITVVFPENKPEPAQEKMQIVENMNESDEIPDNTNLLSDRNSRARNEKMTEIIKDTPFSEGNVLHENLSAAMNREQLYKPSNKPFTKDALTGKQVTDFSRQKKESDNPLQNPQTASMGTNQILNQNKFSAEEVGTLSLSTYAWEWAPYINRLKLKHSSVWYAPPAYTQLGLIHGQTTVAFEIARDGSLVSAVVVDHKGHESLEISSFESIKAIFPFLPLPENFPDPTLKITATLIYPDLRKLYNERRR